MKKPYLFFGILFGLFILLLIIRSYLPEKKISPTDTNLSPGASSPVTAPKISEAPRETNVPPTETSAEKTHTLKQIPKPMKKFQSTVPIQIEAGSSLCPNPDFSKIVGYELKRLCPGRILFNPAKEMKVGVRERIEVRITKNFTEDLSKGLRGWGAPQIEKIKVGTFMKVRLEGDNFDIKPLSHEGQVVVGDGFTQWEWDVVPLESGIQYIFLIVAVRFKLPNHIEETKDAPVFERQIKVKVNPIYSTTNFMKSHWQWIIATIFSSGIIGWVIKKRRSSRKKTNSERNNGETTDPE